MADDDWISAGEAQETKRKKTKSDCAVVMDDMSLNSSNNVVAGGNDCTDAKVDLKAEISCTACHRNINVNKPGSIHEHPILKVLICKSCFKWYTSGTIEQGSDGMDEQCRWCGEGGKLVLCDFCNNAFCKDCIRQNLGKNELATITAENSKWHCYICNAEPLKDLVSYCKALQQAVNMCDGKAAHSSNRTSGTDTDSNCASTSQGKDHHCFFTSKNVESLTDDLYSQTSSWVKKLTTLKSDLKKLNSKSGSSSTSTIRRKEDFAKKIFKHFLSLDETMMKFKMSAQRKTHVKAEKVVAKPAGKRDKKENGVGVLDVSFSGNESEVSGSNVLKAIGSLNNEETSQSSGIKLVSQGEDNAELPDAVGGEAEVEDEMEVEESQEESKASDGRSTQTVEDTSVLTCSTVQDDVVSGNPKIRLTISLPKINQADLEAQRQLHLEGRNSKSKSDSEDEDKGDEVEEEEEDVEEQKEDKKESTDEESDAPEEEEEEGESSSAEEYNPKHDLHDLKSERRHERQARAKRTKTRAAKRSLQRIREAVQKKKMKAKEAEEETIKNKKKGKGKSEGKDKKKDSGKDSEEKKKGERTSERLKRSSSGDRKYKEQDSAEEEEDGEKPAVKAEKKSKKLKEKGTSDTEEENANDGDEEVGGGDAEGGGKKRKKGDKKKNVKSEKTKERDSNGEENEEKENEGKDEEKEEDEGGKKKTKRGAGKKKKKTDADGEEEEEEEGHGETDDLDEEIKRLEKMPQLKSDAKSSSAARKKKKDDDDDDEVSNTEEQSEKTTEKKKDEKRKKKGTLVDELSAEEDGATDEEEEQEEEAAEAEKDEQETNAPEQGDDSNDQSAVAVSGDEDKDARARKALVDESDEEAGTDNEETDAEVEEEEEAEDKKKKQKKNSGALVIKDSDDDDDEEEEEEEEAEDEGSKKKHKSHKLLSIPLSSSEDESAKKKKKKRGAAKKADDSEDDFVIKKRRGKRRRRESSSKSESDQSDDSMDKKEKMKKKRRRIRANSSSENESGSGEDGSEDGSDDDDLTSPKGKKRKKIHKILGDKKLSKETLDAAKAEEERRQRIAERQKLFNQVVVEDSNSPTKCPVTTKLQLEVDEESKEAIIEVHKKLICKLKPHQVEAVKFMWNCCVESLERLKTEEGSGCILAHCMGLGKTLSVISFVHTMLRNKKLTKIKTCLVLCPLNTILNWESEFENWLADVSPVDVYELSTVKDNWGRSEVIKDWQEGGGVLIVGYEMFRTLSQLSRVKNKKQKKIFTEALLDPGPDLVICDEGHILKNDATGLSKACNLIKSRRRVVLTGTPLQNNLIEYHCMVTFVKPKLLGTRKEFSNRFVNPITNGQCSDSTPYDVKIMKRRAHILHETLAGCVQRKDYSALTKYLLPKHEYVVLIRLSKVQIELYEKYLQRLGEDMASQAVRGSRIFTDYQNLMKIWTHPWVLKLDEIRQENRKIFKDEYDSFIDDSEYESDLSGDSKTSKSVEEVKSGSEDEWKPKRLTRGAAKQKKEESTVPKEKAVAAPKEKVKPPNGSKKSQPEGESDEEEVVKGYKTRSRGGGPVIDEPMEVVEDDTNNRVSSEWWADYISSNDQFNLEISGKLMLLSEILKMAESIGDKVLVFSQSLLSLNLIENFLAHWDKLVASEPEKQVAGTQGWDKGVDYIRMDGSTSAQNRKEWTAMFNDEENVKARLFLISTKAGSLGINLVAANRVIIFDASWNPTHDVQSIFRVYRFGQTKPVYVYRFLAQGTMEEKIYERQVTKQSLAQRVIDEHQIERHFTAADLRELYVFKPDRLDDPNRPERPTPKLPKDRMLAELLTNQKDLIVQYHEHDSLLENKIAEELSEEERKAAWEEYEQEKKGLRPPPQPSQYNMGAAAMGAAAMIQNMASLYQPTSYQMSSYIPDAHKIAQAIFASNPGISEAELKQRVQYYLQMQLANQQRVLLAQQQKQEMEKLQRMQEERMRQQMMLHRMGFNSSENAGAAQDGGVLSSVMIPPGNSSRAASVAPNSKGSGASSASSSK